MRIGVVLNILDEEYQISVYKGIEQRAQELGVELICFQQENTHITEDELVARFPHKEYFDLDGVILVTSVITGNADFNTKADVERIWGDIPVISVGQKIEGIPSVLIETEDSPYISFSRNISPIIHIIRYNKSNRTNNTSSSIITLNISNIT